MCETPRAPRRRGEIGGDEVLDFSGAGGDGGATLGEGHFVLV